MQTERKAQQFSRGTRTPDRGRGRGRGRGINSTLQTASGFQQRHDQLPRGGPSTTFRGRGRGSSRGRGTGTHSERFNGPDHTALAARSPTLPINPPLGQIKSYDHETLETRRSKLNEKYEQFRQRAVEYGLMSDDQQSSLETAIKTVGTCTQMCDEKERVNRIYENQVDLAERLPCPETGRSVPIEGRMVKKFRRSAAGVDKQIPEELRTPRTLQITLDYLFDEIVGKYRLGKHHKFVWDRTRAIRNDFSIQSSSKPQDVKYEVDCYERIVRFHIVSAHQLSNPENLGHDEHFEHQQELEQLQKTFQSLMDKYDAFRSTVDFANEAEFRAYYIVFSPVLFAFDTEAQIQQWPQHVLRDGRVQTALRLYAAMGNTNRSVGSKNLDPIPVAVAQANVGYFWTLLTSQKVGYLMACIAEISFQTVRFTALDALWRTAKGAPEKGQATMRSWTKEALTEYLCYDTAEETEDLCTRLGISFSTSSNGQQYLDFRSKLESRLDNPFSKPEQVFCEEVVESKRHGRTLVAIMNGMSIAEARRAGMVEDESELASIQQPTSQRNQMFVQDDDEDEEIEQSEPQQPVFSLNPAVSAFTPGAFASSTESVPKGIFGTGRTEQQRETASFAPSKSAFPDKANPFSSSLDQIPSSASQEAAISTPAFSGFSFSPAATQKASPTAFTPPEQSKVLETAGHNGNQPSIFNLTSEKRPEVSSNSKSVFGWTPTPTTISEPENAQSSALGSSTQFSPGPGFLFTSSSASVQPSKTQTSNSFSFSFSPSTDASSQIQPSTSTPLFSSLKPDQPVASGAAAFNPEAVQARPVGALSPTTQPPISAFQFPTVSKQLSEQTSITPAGSPARAISTQKAIAPPSLSQSSLVQSQLQSLPHPTASVDTISPAPEPRQIDEEELLSQLSRIGLVQKDGILDMFISYKISTIVKDGLNVFREQRRASQLAVIKKKHLQRKFFAIWRSTVDHRRLKKQAQRRRNRLAASVKAASEKEKQQEQEMKEIQEAENFRKQLQESARRSEKEMEQQQKDRQIQHDANSMKPPPNPPQKAGRKRKMLANSSSSSNLNGIAMTPTHKRSRTLGSTQDTDTLNLSMSLPARSPRATLTGSTNLRRSMSQKSLRQSITQQRLDQTETDYFRLKAHGVDPDTPLVPDTAASLAARRQKEAEHRDMVTQRVLQRPSSAFNKSRLLSSSTIRSPVQGVTLPPDSPTSTLQPVKQLSMSRSSRNDEDPFLQQLREAREALSTDENWFKSHTAEIEQEIVQQDQSRRSIGSNPGRHGSFSYSTHDSGRSLSLLNYVAPELKPGQTLSKTEERIRRTGAKGLASRPFGGTPRSMPSYVPVAMSRRSASRLSFGQNQDAPRGSEINVRHLEVEQMNGHVHESSNMRQQLPQDTSNIGSDQQYFPVNKTPRSIDNIDTVTMAALNKLRDIPTPFDIVYDGHGNEHSSVGTDSGTDQYEIEDAYATGPSRVYVDENGEEYDEDDYDEEEEEDDDDVEGGEEEYTDQEVDAGDDNNQYAEYEGEEESDVYDDVDEDGIPLPPHAKYHSSHGHGSRAASASVATPDTGVGSTLDAAIELSD